MEPTQKNKKRIIKFAPSFRKACRENLGWSEEETRRLELDVIKRQAKLREGIRECARCGADRTDDVDSDICGTCADDLRQEQEAWSGSQNTDTGAD